MTGLKKHRSFALSVAEKKQRIEPDHPRLSIQRQCGLIGLPRSSYYRKDLTSQETSETRVIMRLIDEEYTRHPFYGSRKMRDFLNRHGHSISRKRIQRLMHRMGIQSVAPSRIRAKDIWSTKYTPIFSEGLISFILISHILTVGSTLLAGLSSFLMP